MVLKIEYQRKCIEIPNKSIEVFEDIYNEKLKPDKIKEKLKEINFYNIMSDFAKSLKKHISRGEKIEDFLRNYDLPENYEILGFNCQYSERKINQNSQKKEDVKVRVELGFVDTDVSVCGIINLEPDEEKIFNLTAFQALVSFRNISSEELATKLSINQSVTTSDSEFLKLQFGKENLRHYKLPVSQYYL